MTHRYPKDYRHLVDAALEAGWRIVHKRRHDQLRAPDGRGIVTIPGTPGDVRSIRNLRAELRRQGVNA